MYTPSIFPSQASPSRNTPIKNPSGSNGPNGSSREAQDAARVAVRDLLQRSQAFSALDENKRRELANNLVQIGTYLAEPDGVRLPNDKQAPAVRALATPVSSSRSRSAGNNTNGDGVFSAQAAREGAAVAGALLDAVNFPEFVSGLIDGVFHSIVQSSIQQMEAYAKMVADVAKSMNDFRDDNTTQNQGRDHLISKFPDIFELTVDTGDFGAFGDDGNTAAAGPRVAVREGVNETAALERINRELPVGDRPLTRLDDEVVEAALVPAARTQLATGRQQLLATMVMLGINRIVVTDGKISAKVMYEFKARDNMQFKRSAQQFDYGDQYSTTSSGENETDSQGGERTRSYNKDGGESSVRDGSYYSKGTYKNTSQPVLKLASASQTSINASLDTKASLMGAVEVNFKSDYLPLDKIATPEAMAQIQMNAQPGMVSSLAKNRPASNAPATATPNTPASTPPSQ